VIFSLVAQRALEPGSKLAACRWAAERVAIEGLVGLDAETALCRNGVSARCAGRDRGGDLRYHRPTLLNLACHVIFVDTTSTHWQLDNADELAELAATPARTTGSRGRPSRRPALGGTPRITGPRCRRW
jgi:hypothetical protein